jgi:hypothetical protein
LNNYGKSYVKGPVAKIKLTTVTEAARGLIGRRVGYVLPLS